MAVLEILRFPDPRLHTIAQPVTDFGPRLQTLVNDMAQTMYEAPGIGLAATQVDVHLRVVVIDISEDRSDLRVFVNPEIVTASGTTAKFEEGCLSVPEIYENVERPDHVTVRAVDRHGKAFTLDCEGLLAVCVQHEIDHLNGKVFVQHLSRLKQSRIKAKLSKRDREAA